jgi:acetyl esterase/lipase
MAAIEMTQVAVEKDVVFGKGGDRELKCDVYRPAPGTEKHVGIIHIHGGGFLRGSKEGARVARPLAALGYLGVAMQYRLAPDAKWPSQIEDVKAAIRWTRANAGQLGIDPDKIVVLGHSAGGHLSLVASGSQNLADFEGRGGNADANTSVAACVAFYAGTGGNRVPAGAEHPVLGLDPSEDTYRSFTPLSYVRPGFPPTIILHGTADQSIPVAASVKLYQAMIDAGVPVELHVVDGVTHVFDAHDDLAEESSHWIDLFLDRHVAKPRQYASTEPGR